MQAINWLRQQWVRGMNAVLADDKGLGRTATVITFLQCLRYFACTPLSPGLCTSRGRCWAVTPAQSFGMLHQQIWCNILQLGLVCTTHSPPLTLGVAQLVPRGCTETMAIMQTPPCPYLEFYDSCQHSRHAGTSSTAPGLCCWQCKAVS